MSSHLAEPAVPLPLECVVLILHVFVHFPTSLKIKKTGGGRVKPVGSPLQEIRSRANHD